MTYSIISQSIYYVYPLLACVSDIRLKKLVNSPPTGRPAVTCDRHLAIGQSTGHRCNTGDVDAQGAPWAGSATFWCCHFEFCFIHVLYRSSSVDCHDSWLMYDSMVCFTVVRDSWETVFLSPHNGTLSFGWFVGDLPSGFLRWDALMRQAGRSHGFGIVESCLQVWYRGRWKMSCCFQRREERMMKEWL